MSSGRRAFRLRARTRAGGAVAEPGPLNAQRSRDVLGLLSRVRAWLGRWKLHHGKSTATSNGSDSMPAMSDARQMEQVLESLAASPVAAKRAPGAQPQWRLVSRDGSTSSVAGPGSAVSKQGCPDCLAGRCGQNPHGCECSRAGEKGTISLKGLDNPPHADDFTTSRGKTSINADMPRANPRLFEDIANYPTISSSESSPGSRCDLSPGSGPNIREAVSRQKPGQNPGPGEEYETESHGQTSSGGLEPTTESSIDDLQRVIDRWPRLNRSTRRAILVLIGVSNEADRA